MGFVYVSERELFRTHILLMWKKGSLHAMSEGIMQLIAQFSAPPWPTQPVRKLTVQLLTTYTGINDKYYKAKQSFQSRGQVSNGNFQWTDGDVLTLNDRYKLRQQIGHGAFGVVMRADDLKTGAQVAIKIIKAKRAYTQQAMREVNLLLELKSKDVDGTSQVVELIETFVYNNPNVGAHQCLVFEMLSSNLYTLLEQVNFHGFSVTLVRKFGYSLLQALNFLARPDLQVIHTDVKPENICIRNPRRSALKLIDFGSSCKDGEQLYTYIQSRYYRSPEVLLGCKYTVAIDMWSLACVLVEMHTGCPLFSGDNQVDQLRRIMQLLGPPPDHMIERYSASKRDQLFIRSPSSPSIISSSPSSPLTFPSSSKPRKWLPIDTNLPSRSIQQVLGSGTGGPSGRWVGQVDHSPEDYAKFEDFIMKTLVYDPKQRMTPAQGLAHPFFQVLVNASNNETRARTRQAAASDSVTSNSRRRIVSDDEADPTTHIAQHHRDTLDSALASVGCPSQALETPLTADTITHLLARFTDMEISDILEAKQLFAVFMEQSLRTRRDAALREFIVFLETRNPPQSTSAMEVDVGSDLSRTAAP